MPRSRSGDPNWIKGCTMESAARFYGTPAVPLPQGMGADLVLDWSLGSQDIYFLTEDNATIERI